MENLHNTVKGLTALNPQEITTDTTTVGATIDTAEASSVSFRVSAGAITDGDYTFQIFEDDDSGMGTETLVAATEVLGDKYNEVTNPTAGDLFTFGLIKNKRYARLKIVTANVTSGGYCSAIAELANLRASLATDRNP